MAEPTTAGRAFDAEALPHLDALYRVALRLTGDPTQAEDLVQDTMLKAYRSWQQYRPGTNAKGWLLTILRNTFINDYRRRKLEPVATDLEAVEPHAIYRAVEDVDPEGAFFDKIVDEKVLEAIDALPPDFREVLVLSDMEGLRYGEIAETLQVPGRHGQVPALPGAAAAPGGAVRVRGRDRASFRPGRRTMGEPIDCQRCGRPAARLPEAGAHGRGGGRDAGPPGEVPAVLRARPGSSRPFSRCSSNRPGGAAVPTRSARGS